MSNKTAKERLIELYGNECFIDKLHLRKDKDRKYTSKKQMERMKQLTFHHIKEKRNGGQATVENEALLSEENHIWFNKQSTEVQAKMNIIFQEYKKCNVEYVENLPTTLQVKIIEFNIREKEKEYNRAKEKENLRKRIKEELENEI